LPSALTPRDTALAERLGVRPLPPDLLNEALTHSSYVNESDSRGASNERLEFLGDAVLGFVTADLLFKSFPDAGEGLLTRMRAELVRGRTLARAAERLQLGDYLVLGRGEAAAGGRDRDRNLAGAVEALIGAVYRAHGIRAARALVRRLLRPELQKVFSEGATLDPKSRLQQLVQGRWRKPPEYVTVETAGDPEGKFIARVLAEGTELGQGRGPTKRAAQQEAARHALAQLASGGSEA